MKGQKKLTPRQEAALVALLTEPTRTAAAAKAQVGEVTLWRWLKQSEFQAAYRDLRRRAVDDAVGQLQQALVAAAAALRRGLDCGQTGAEIRAARAIFDQAAKWTELLDFSERLAELERLTGLAPEGPSP